MPAARWAARALGAWGASWRVLLATRALCFAAAVLAAALITHHGGNEAGFDVLGLTHPFGAAGDALFSPLARWDAVWYLSIGLDGYGASGGPDAAFFPLYPLLVWLVGTVIGVGLSPASALVAAYLVSLGAFGGALYLFHRLVELELGRELALPALLALALFPAAFFLGAPYAESLFLLTSVGAFYAARTNHWAWAGIAAAGASATRSAGILLLIPLAIFYVQGHAARPPHVRARGRWDWAWLALAPVGLFAFTGFLALTTDDPFAYLDAQTAWYRDFAGPFLAIPDATVAAFDGARQLLSGSRSPVYFSPAGGDPFEVARINLMLFGFLVFALIALVGTFRRLPLAYGVYALAALALPLSFPVEPQPLMSLPRFLCVLFPLFMWLAAWAHSRRATTPVLGVSTALLVVLTAQFATWQWVA